MNEPLLLRTLKKEKTERIPFWFMRQAGRYLPEYQAIRKDFSNFLAFCYTPEAACEVTLQPIRRFDMDAAILFCDILVIPDALGQKVQFVKGEGPKLDALSDDTAIASLSTARIEEHLAPVQETIRLLRRELPEDKALIGFSGSPWTLACYMIEGGGSREFQTARAFALSQPEAFARLLTIVTDAVARYVQMQADAGAQVIQLFDSWAGVVPAAQFEDWVIEPTRRIIEALKEKHPNVPVIGFAKGAGGNLKAYAAELLLDAVGVDQHMPLSMPKRTGKVLQGNLDNVTLAADKKEAVRQTHAILEAWTDIPFIFNLGHGILPHTPIDHVEAVVEKVKSWKR